jgi:hypothetical protein
VPAVGPLASGGEEYVAARMAVWPMKVAATAATPLTTSRPRRASAEPISNNVSRIPHICLLSDTYSQLGDVDEIANIVDGLLWALAMLR